MRTTFKTPGEKLWLVGVAALLFLIAVMIVGPFIPDKHPSNNTPETTVSQQTQVEPENTLTRMQREYSDHQRSLAAEALYIKIMKENMSYTDVPLFAAALITYNHDCATLDNTIMDEAHKIAKERINDMELALWNAKVLANGTVGARPKFCKWFGENVVSKILGASLK